MIAIAVVAVVLAGAYVTTNRSLQATRAAEERSIALKLGESQIERLKGLMATASTLIANAPQQFCIAASNNQPVATNDTSGACAVASDGTPAPSGTQPMFRLSIAKTAANDFMVTVQWDDVNGIDQDSLQLRYRVYG
jgi:hypothetical protein